MDMMMIAEKVVQCMFICDEPPNREYLLHWDSYRCIFLLPGNIHSI